MANPTPAAVDWIRSHVTDWTPTDQELADGLNGDMVPNPTPQPTVPTPFLARDCMSLLSSASVADILGIPSFDSSIRPLLNIINKSQEDISNLNDWAGALFKGGKLTQTEYDALAAPAPGTTAGAQVGLFNRTGPDPDWPATLPRPVVELGRTLDADDIQAARPEGA